MMTDQRKIFIREHVYKHEGVFQQIEFEFIESESSIQRNYHLWLTQEHYQKTIRRRIAERMPGFEEYVNAIRVLIAGHCCSEDDLRRAFHVYDENRNGLIELEEFNRLIGIIGRSTTEEKISNFLERVNPNDDRSLNYEQFKQFVRLGYGREMLVNVSMPT